MQVDIPVLRVMIGDTLIYGVIALRLEQAGYFSADRFNLHVALGPAPMFDAAYYTQLGLQTITIEVAVNPGGFVNLFTGQIDNIRINFSDLSTVLSGRDLSARLIDAEISETFANQTASQVAATIAARHGLVGNIMATSTPVGQYYELDHARSGLGVNSQSGTEWNLLVQLALAENFNLSVNGTTLNFGSAVTPSPSIIFVQDCVALTADFINVLPASATVISWNTRQKAAVTQTAGSAGGGSTTIVRPNLTASQAKSLATYHLETLSQHATMVTATLPGELDMAPNSVLSLIGTQSSMDQLYMIDTVVREIDMQQGFVQTVKAHALPAAAA